MIAIVIVFIQCSLYSLTFVRAIVRNTFFIYFMPVMASSLLHSVNNFGPWLRLWHETCYYFMPDVTAILIFSIYLLIGNYGKRGFMFFYHKKLYLFVDLGSIESRNWEKCGGFCLSTFWLIGELEERRVRSSGSLNFNFDFGFWLLTVDFSFSSDKPRESYTAITNFAQCTDCTTYS